MQPEATHVLLGKPLTHPDVQKLIAEWGQFEIKQIKNTTYHNFKNAGISLCILQENGITKVDSIYVYNSGVDGFAQYKGNLPFDLSFDMTNADVVNKLGEPEGKPPKGNVISMFVDYKKTGIAD